MALPPLPENNTGRLFIDYTTGRLEHTLIFRFGASATAADALGRAELFLGALQSLLAPNWAPVSARVQEAGELIALPFDLGGLTEFSGGLPTDIPEADEPRQFKWVGRGVTSGRKTSVGLYGLGIAQPPDYRYSGLELQGQLENALNVLRNGAVTAPVTIAGDAATWYDYVNVQYNSYWERRARG